MGEPLRNKGKLRRVAAGELLATTLRRHAVEVFGDAAKAELWLRSANPALNSQSPLDALASEDGVSRVNDILGRIEHGVLS